MKIEFLKIEKASNGQWAIDVSYDNGLPELKWVTDEEAALIFSAMAYARNEVRNNFRKLMDYERVYKAS